MSRLPLQLDEAFTSKTTWHNETPRSGGREAYVVTYRVGMDKEKSIKVFATRQTDIKKTRASAIKKAKTQARVGRGRFTVLKVSGPGLNEDVSLFDLVVEGAREDWKAKHRDDRLAANKKYGAQRGGHEAARGVPTRGASNKPYRINQRKEGPGFERRNAHTANRPETLARQARATKVRLTRRKKERQQDSVEVSLYDLVQEVRAMGGSGPNSQSASLKRLRKARERDRAAARKPQPRKPSTSNRADVTRYFQGELR